MANLVLYRKYRPKAFKEVVGQDVVVNTLKAAVALNLISHAYLFSGPRGSGKTTTARLLAKAVNCEKPGEGEPCNTCKNCKAIMEGKTMDLVEIDAASNRGIDEMRELRDGIRFAPTFLKYKVFVIDEAHQLTKDAANALLKTLEEPPAHAIFILATTEAHKMIPTIVSRCQRFDFRKLRVKEIVSQLAVAAKQEKLNIEKEALEVIAARSGGSLRDAMGLLEKVLTFATGRGITQKVERRDVQELLGIGDQKAVADLVEAVAEKDAAKAMGILNDALREGTDPFEFGHQLVDYLRHVLVMKVSPDLSDTASFHFSEEETKVIQEQASKFTHQDLIKIIDRFMAAENSMKLASIVQLPLEVAIVDSCINE